MRRDGRLLFALLLLLAAGCGEATSIPAHDAWIGVEVGAETVETGRAFALTVTRVWRKEDDAAAWDDQALAPLAVRLEQRIRQEDEERVQEIRRFRAYAFARDAVTVPPVPFAVRPRGGGAVRTVHAAAFTIRPRPALLPATAGPPELPGGPLAEPSSRAAWIGLALGLALIAGVAFVAARRRRVAVPKVSLLHEEPAPPAAHETALDALARERAAGRAVGAVTDVVRRYVAARFDVPALYLPTEEILAATGIEAGPRQRLDHMLRLGDRTKFASYEATPGEREAHLETAEAFVRETAEGGAS